MPEDESRVKWFDDEDKGISIRVSVPFSDKAFKVEFFDYESAQSKDHDELTNKDRLANSISAGDVEFYNNPYWRNQIKKRFEDSTKLDIEDEEIEKVVNSFCMTAEDVLPNLLEASKSEEEKKAQEDMQITEEKKVDEEWAEEKAEEWLESPDLLSKIDRTIHHHLAGETSNALLVYISMASAKTHEPNTLRPTGESSIGKTFLVTRVAKLFPDEMKIIRKGFSEMAVWNKARPIKGVEDRRIWNLWGKILVILEEETAEEFLEQFRPVLSHDEKKITYEVTNTESQSRETLKIDILGWPAYIGMRVGGKMDDQEETRAMKMTPDSGSAKYSKAVWWNARKRETPWLDEMRQAHTEIAKKMAEKLDRYKVLIPYREEIQKYFPTEEKRHMRDWNQFQALIEAMTVLHQRQRPRVEIEGEEYLISHPDDVKAVVMIARDSLAETLHGLDSRLRKFWKHLSERGRVSGYNGLMEEYERCFGESASKSTIREQYIEPLEDIGMIKISQGKGSRPHSFKAEGSLTTISPKLDKVVESAYEIDVEDSTFSHMLSDDIGPSHKPIAMNCEEWMGDNPVTIGDTEAAKSFWGGLLNTDSIIDHNRDLLERGYEDDYGYREKETGEKEEVKVEEKKPEVEPLEELSQKELMEKLYEFYKERKTEASIDGLDYPHMVDFADRASSLYEEPKSRVIEACRKMSQENKDVIFDKSGMDSGEEEEKLEIEPREDEEEIDIQPKEG